MDNQLERMGNEGNRDYRNEVCTYGKTVSLQTLNLIKMFLCLKFVRNIAGYSTARRFVGVPKHDLIFESHQLSALLLLFLTENDFC